MREGAPRSAQSRTDRTQGRGRLAGQVLGGWRRLASRSSWKLRREIQENREPQKGKSQV